VKVCSKKIEVRITKMRANSLRVCEFNVGVEIGVDTLSLFNDAIDDLVMYIGEVIKIADGWAKSWRYNTIIKKFFYPNFFKYIGF